MSETRQSGARRDHPQRRHRRDGGDEDQFDAHGVYIMIITRRSISPPDFTAKGETVSIGLGLRRLFADGGDDQSNTLAFGPSGTEIQDILLTNDTPTSPRHLNHMTFSLPSFTKAS
jgi:hypothetical protein